MNLLLAVKTEQPNFVALFVIAGMPSFFKRQNVLFRRKVDHFEFAVTADNKDNVFNLYSLSLTMKLNIPKCNAVLHYC